MLHNEARKLLIQALEKTHNAREVADQTKSFSLSVELFCMTIPVDRSAVHLKNYHILEAKGGISNVTTLNSPQESTFRK